MSRCLFFCAFFLSLFLALNWRLQEQTIIMSGKRGRYTKKQTPKRNWIVALLCFLKYVVDRWYILFHVCGLQIQSALRDTDRCKILSHFCVCSLEVVPRMTPATSMYRPSLVLQQLCIQSILNMPRQTRSTTTENVAVYGFLKESVNQQW